MRTRLALWLVAVLGLAASAQAQTPATLLYKTAHWKGTVSINGAQPSPSESWFSAPTHFRFNAQMMGMPTICILKGDDMFSFQEGNPTGMKFNLKSLPAIAKGADGAVFLKKSQEWKAKGKKLGSEPVNGRPCDIYEFDETPTGQAMKGKVWLWTKNDFPLRTQLQAGGMNTEMTVTEIEINGPIDPSIFQVPANIQFQDLSELMKNIPGLQQLQKAQ